MMELSEKEALWCEREEEMNKKVCGGQKEGEGKRDEDGEGEGEDRMRARESAVICGAVMETNTLIYVSPAALLS